MRKLCKVCQEKNVAVNYYKNDKIFYRSKCDQCSRNKIDQSIYLKKSNYKKKQYCEKCGFSSKFPEQFEVLFLDGNFKNCQFTNLKTVCANCFKLIKNKNISWKQGDLVPDF
jgi:hypothetical protein